MENNDLSKLRIDKTTSWLSRKKGVKWSRVVAVICLLIAAAVLYRKGIFFPSVQVEVASVAKIYPSQAFTLLNASGYVVAQRKAAVASKVTGRLVELSVEEGSRVKKGEIIARLESEDAAAFTQRTAATLDVARSNLKQAEAELYEAALLLERSRELLSRGFISRTEFDSADARYRKAVAGVSAGEASVKAGEAALREAEVSLEYALIRAPFDAVVLTKNADIGDIITPLGAAANARASVVTVADMESLQVEVDVSESNIEQVRMEQPCEIQLDALPGSRFRGKVHMIVPTADRTKASILVKISFTDKDRRILPEMSAKVAFLERAVKEGEEKPRTSVSSAAVIEKGGEHVVFLVSGDKAVETRVKVGEIFDEWIEITEGVKTGDKVVINPPENLKSGSKIKGAEQ